MFQCAYRDPYLLYTDNLLETPDDSSSLIHINEAHEIIYCVSGSLTANIEGVRYTVMPGDLLLIRDAEMHITAPETLPTQFHHIKFSPYYFNFFDTENRICRPFSEHPFGIGNLVPGSRLNRPLIENCFANIRGTRDAYMRRVAVFGTLMMILSDVNQCYDYDRSHHVDTRSAVLQEIITYINSHLDEDLNPDKIASRLYISRSQLDRIFKQNIGFTLWKYITFKRLIRARHLLHAGIANNEVARLCGFGDYSTFYKVYTKVWGRPPRAAQPNETTDPLLKQFYKFDDTASIIDATDELEGLFQRMKRLQLE
ncbi:MAG: helix-turn-helix domain-containing protein [Ruminococcaceae bacterium]|nr:helix-turn-helix domain-containing protein [Oscillospiraceae bacterium]